MYSYEDRIRSVKLYIKFGNTNRIVIYEQAIPA